VPKGSSGNAIVGGLFALGLMALASSARSDRRRDFYQVLRDRLAEYDVDLVSAELGRHRGDAVWVVTVEADGRATRVQVTVTGEPYSAGTAVEVADEVAEALGVAR
jgi:hypothetical protein